jgi:cryptochrome
LIDHEAAVSHPYSVVAASPSTDRVQCNIGNWQWLSCTAFYAQFYRCYSPMAFGKKWDDNGDFIRKYVPELKDVPKKYIYEPHKAPIQDQKKAKVVIKGDGTEDEIDGMTAYPKPMFDFNTQREICIQGMKNAYHVGLYGNHPKVLDGTWKELFPDDAEGPTAGKQGGPGGLDSWEDADGAEENHQSAPATPKRGLKKEPSDASPKSTRKGHKREHSQGTLDSTFKKKAKS